MENQCQVCVKVITYNILEILFFKTLLPFILNHISTTKYYVYFYNQWRAHSTLNGYGLIHSELNNYGNFTDWRRNIRNGNTLETPRHVKNKYNSAGNKMFKAVHVLVLKFLGKWWLGTTAEQPTTKL